MTSLVSLGFTVVVDVFVPFCGIVGEFGVYSLCTLVWQSWWVWDLQSLYPCMTSLVSLGFTVFVDVLMPFHDIISEFQVYSHCRCLCTLPWHRWWVWGLQFLLTSLHPSVIQTVFFLSIPWKDKIKLPVQVWLLVSFCWSWSSSRGACGGGERERELVPVWPLALPMMTVRSCWTDLWRTHLTLSVRSATLTSLCPSVTSRHRWASILYDVQAKGWAYYK